MKTNKGLEYAVICLNGKDTLVHRIVLFLVNDKWPDHSDHLCNNTKCVSPLHLEDVSQAENNKRMATRKGRKEFCKRGHKMTSENSKIHVSHLGYTTINCRECDKLRKRNSYNTKNF